jgi:16S rRNA (cytidine1402-2'-O)-methyltransferase
MSDVTPSVTSGRLYLVPAPLDFGCATQTPLQDVLPQGTLLVAARLQHWICENAKSARAYLKRVNEIQPLACPIQSLQIQELPHEVHKRGITAATSTPAICSHPSCWDMTWAC